MSIKMTKQHDLCLCNAAQVNATGVDTESGKTEASQTLRLLNPRTQDDNQVQLSGHSLCIHLSLCTGTPRS
jgi:hypothetical protein